MVTTVRLVRKLLALLLGAAGVRAGAGADFVRLAPSRFDAFVCPVCVLAVSAKLARGVIPVVRVVCVAVRRPEVALSICLALVFTTVARVLPNATSFSCHVRDHARYPQG